MSLDLAVRRVHALALARRFRTACCECVPRFPLPKKLKDPIMTLTLS
jgi:hypothetical protein